MIRAAFPQVDINKLADYALRMESHALAQRLGYLLETQGMTWPSEIETRLLSRVEQAKTYLGPTSQWGKGGEYNARWQIIANVPRQQLMGEIRIA